mmetsp:Transcript_11197/g.29830  ORF Transcript_11197/g.29830 Transcript_11197/m.29830 type:complete len:106 (-) Transcript_11197:184-501(-)
MSTGKLLDVASNENVFVMEMVEVNGSKTHPVFEFLKYNSSLYNESSGLVTPIAWNFGKFVVEPAGGVFKYYGPQTEPLKIVPDIQQILGGGATATPTRRPSAKAT